MSKESDKKFFTQFTLIVIALTVLMIIFYVLGGKYGGGNTTAPLNINEAPTEVASAPAETPAPAEAAVPANEPGPVAVVEETATEEVTETAVEVTEEVTETAVEVTEEVAETAAEATEEVAETATEAAEEVATAAATADTGGIDAEAIYNKVCVACHAGAIPGIPKLGDKAAWEPRIAQGMDVLYDHAINGFMGTAMMMPPRGGGSISDEEVKATVDYMVESSQ